MTSVSRCLRYVFAIVTCASVSALSQPPPNPVPPPAPVTVHAISICPFCVSAEDMCFTSTQGEGVGVKCDSKLLPGQHLRQHNAGVNFYDVPNGTIMSKTIDTFVKLIKPARICKGNTYYVSDKGFGYFHIGADGVARLRKDINQEVTPRTLPENSWLGVCEGDLVELDKYRMEAVDELVTKRLLDAQQLLTKDAIENALKAASKHILDHELAALRSAIVGDVVKELSDKKPNAKK